MSVKGVLCSFPGQAKEGWVIARSRAGHGSVGCSRSTTVRPCEFF